MRASMQNFYIGKNNANVTCGYDVITFRAREKTWLGSDILFKQFIYSILSYRKKGLQFFMISVTYIIASWRC